jgi:hypothetical protein
MKLAVVTLCFGDFDQLAEITHPILKNYADKINADFIVINKKVLSKKFIHYEKMQISNLLTQYDRILYFDTDIIIRSDCPNLFDIIPQTKLGLMNEGRFYGAQNVMPIMQEACKKFSTSIPKWEGQYYNTGVMVISKIHRDIFVEPDVEHDTYSGFFHYEQPYLNLKILSENIKVEELSYKYNRMSLMNALTGENMLSSYVVHYAGQRDFKQLKIDITNHLQSWEETAPEYFYPKNIYIRVGGGLGDQIDAEPVIRWACENSYKNDNIYVKCDFPVVLKHLPIKLVEDKRFIGEACFEMETLPSPNSPLWQYVAQTLCHTTDFSSISMLRRILPDIDKQIHLEVTDSEVESLKATFNLQDLENSVLIHPGKGWESKTFPPSYWQGIIDSLVKENVPIILIGKWVSDDQGVVDIDATNVIDLRNVLSLKELMALISKAKITISNDSAPIHIAGAFDNWIVLIPTCKHPDHVLPYRNGTKSYKTVALYKKLTTDSIDSSPTQIEGQTIDYVIGDILDYLPDINEVVDQIKNIYLNF